MDTTFTAITPDGKRETRTSKKAYTHAVAITEEADKRWEGWAILSFHTSEALARKAAERATWADSTTIVPVS